jgi:hypothetical protein
MTKISFDSIDIPKELESLIVYACCNTYANGFFRFVQPYLFRNYLSLWSLDANKCIPFVKSAFGHLIFYHEQQYKLLNPIYNCIDKIGKMGDLDFVINILLCDREGLENSFLIDIYEQAFERLGAPKSDEIYGFIPAIRLGGTRSASNLKKMPMKNEMMILSQI